MKSFLVAVLSVLCVSVENAAGLRASVSLNITSDTALSAKNIAMSKARRQIIADALGQYADLPSLKSAIADADNAVLVSLIDSTTIDSEQSSDTTYSAKITMTVNSGAARRWLNDNGIQNWLTDGDNESRFMLTVDMKNPIADWIELNSLAREEGVDMVSKHILGPSMTIEMPISARSQFTIAVRERGWHYGDVDGMLKIWK